MRSLLGVEALDGIAQHGPRHGRGVGVQKPQQPVTIPLTGFPKHTTDGLVDEVVVVSDQQAGKP